MFVIKFLIFFLPLLIFIGCGNNDVPQEITHKFSEIQTTIINPQCTKCHYDSTLSRWANLDLSARNSYYQLTHHKISMDAPHYKALIVPGFPDSSFLIEKLSDNTLSPTNPMGTRMPQGSPPLTENEINIIRSWIKRGAPND
jgi:hypothetical protein